jgi:hypothetical protein
MGGPTNFGNSTGGINISPLGNKTTLAEPQLGGESAAYTPTAAFNPPSGSRLDNMTMGAFGQSLGTFGDLASGGALARTNLTPYLNPFTQNVVDTTMGELNRQQGLGRLSLANEAQSQNAFGGDRFAVENAENDRNWNAQKATTLSNLFNTGFNTATDNAKFDIGAQANAAGQLGSLANQGFNWGNELADRDNRAAGEQQSTLQQLTDAIKGQYQGFTNQGTNPGLNALLAVFQGLGSNMNSSKATSSGSSNSTSIGIGGK